MVALNAMDRQEKPPSRSEPVEWVSTLRGQLKLGLRGEVRKETLLEEVFAFAKGFLFYCQRRLLGAFRLFWHTFASGFVFSADLKSYLQGRLYRKKGQLSFPLAHASLLGISFSLLIFTSGFGEFLYQEVGDLTSGEGAAVVANQPSVATEESELLQTEAQTYIVQEGDTLYSIAEQFPGMTPAALAYTNKITDLDGYELKPGEKLTIPPVEGLIYEVRAGDTIELIAEKYRVELIDIAEFNYLFYPYKLAVGQKLTIPYVRAPGSHTSSGFLTDIPTSTGACGPLSLSWPTERQVVLGGYYYWHQAIDLSARYETLFAGADGTVVAAGGFGGQCFSFGPACNYGYGGYVFIDIGDGYQIRYGHISKPLVGVGEEVSRGDPVAVSGSTGYSFGPHLHFELLCNGDQINPLRYLSGGTGDLTK